MLTDASNSSAATPSCASCAAGLVRRQQDLVRLLKKRRATTSRSPRSAATCATWACSRPAAATCCRRTRSRAPTATSARWRSSCARLQPRRPSLTVVRTTIGAAQSVAVAIDKAEWPEVVGTISGDDTIFIATANARAQRRARRAACAHSSESESHHVQHCRQRGRKPIVLAYSGGLDTSFLVPWVAENYRRPVITVTVDTGGIDAAAARTLRERARALGAIAAPPDRRARRLLRAGAALPDHGQRAPRPALPAVRRRRARHAGADHRAHGAQARHRHRSRTAAPPPATTRCASRSRCARWRRSWRCSRRCATGPSSAQEELDYLQQRKLPVPPYGAAYSINRGLWGVTIGGTGDADLERQHSRRAPGCSRAMPSRSRARRSATRIALRARAARSRSTAQPLDAGRRSSSSSRRWRRRSASAAASISATPSSAPRAAWRSRRRPPRCCSPRTASSRSWC